MKVTDNIVFYPKQLNDPQHEYEWKTNEILGNIYHVVKFKYDGNTMTPNWMIRIRQISDYAPYETHEKIHGDEHEDGFEKCKERIKEIIVEKVSQWVECSEESHEEEQQPKKEVEEAPQTEPEHSVKEDEDEVYIPYSDICNLMGEHTTLLKDSKEKKEIKFIKEDKYTKRILGEIMELDGIKKFIREFPEQIRLYSVKGKTLNQIKEEGYLNTH